MSVGLLTLAFVLSERPAILLAPAAAPAPPTGIQKGDVFTFAGTVAEEVRRPGKEFRRSYDLQIRLFVLERSEKWADVAVMTRLKRTDDAVAGAAVVVTGVAPRQEPPPHLRLDIVRVHANGTVHLLAPAGPAPLRLDAATPARALPLLSLDNFTPSEFGMFPPRPPRDEAAEPWAVAIGPTRPSETWQLQGFDFFNAERCQRLVMNQQSADWLKPVGGVAAWHRAEAVWVSTQDGTARKVHRVIRQRDGRVDAPPAAWVEVKYELQTQARLTGRTYDGPRFDFESAYAALTDAALPLGSRAFELRLAKLEAVIRESDPAGAYREALVAARRALEAAKSGRAAPLEAPPAPAPIAVPRWPEPGQIAPDVRAGSFRLAEHRGKPVVLVFLDPGTETTDLAIAVADALEKRYGGKVVVAPLVVSGEVTAAVKDRDRRKLTIALFDGKQAAAAMAVDSIPRFALIDPAGRIRWTFTGIGNETGFLVREQVDLLAPPVLPNAPAGTIARPGPLPVPLVPPP